MDHIRNHCSHVGRGREGARRPVQGRRYSAVEGWFHPEVWSREPKGERRVEGEAGGIVSVCVGLVAGTDADIGGWVHDSAGIEQSEDMKRFLWYVVLPRVGMVR